MKETLSFPFGLMIAYLLPGFIGLVGLSSTSREVSQWLGLTNQSVAGLGPTVYAVLGAMTLGMILSCFRWLILDHVHQWTGIHSPVWDDRVLSENLAAFDYIVQAHYRYYQFYGNTLVAILVVYGLDRMFGIVPLSRSAADVGVFILCVVLFAGSRDSLKKYYSRTDRMIGTGVANSIRSNDMTNGNHQDHAAGRVTRPSEGSALEKPAAPPKTTEATQLTAKPPKEENTRRT